MIADSETNFLYLADSLKKNEYSSFCEHFENKLKENNISYTFLPNTNDIWARDYMPIQVSDSKFVEYRYDPDYLQEIKYRHLKTYPDLVCDSLSLKTIKTNIIIDGGNVIKSSNSVIMTDKIVSENKEKYKREELINELKTLFEVEKVIFIPWDKAEYFGHADGMIRFIDDGKVLINGYFNEYPKSFQSKLYGALIENGLTIERLNFTVSAPDQRNWAYINYLQMKDFIFIPEFKIEEDKQAFEIFSNLFPDYSERKAIIPVNVTDIVKEGGALNCITWNIKANQ